MRTPTPSRPATIHNIAFQGRFFPRPMSDYGLPESAADDFFFEDGYNKVYDETNRAKEDGKEEFDGAIYRKSNWLKAGFANSDRNLTVSENYAKEISSSKSKGVELDDVIRKYGMEGIVNGMDPTEWNPAVDKFIDVPYDKNTVVEGKAAAKQALQAEVGLPLDAEAPIFGYIGRLEEQKGVDIFMKAVPKLLKAVPTRKSSSWAPVRRLWRRNSKLWTRPSRCALASSSSLLRWRTSSPPGLT